MDKEKEQKEEQAIQEMFSKFQANIEKVRGEIDNITTSEEVELDNVAIILNNVMGQIRQRFKAKGIRFYTESSLKDVIYSKLKIAYNQAYLQLKAIRTISEEMESNYANRDYYLHKADFNEYVKEYKGHCDYIFNYSIEKNIVSDIIEKYNDYKDKTIAKEKVEEYKKELVLLGYGHLIEQIDKQLDVNTKTQGGNSLDDLGEER